MIVDRVLSVDQDRINFGQLAVGTKAEVKARPKGHPTTSSPPPPLSPLMVRQTVKLRADFLKDHLSIVQLSHTLNLGPQSMIPRISPVRFSPRTTVDCVEDYNTRGKLIFVASQPALVSFNDSDTHVQ